MYGYQELKRDLDCWDAAGAEIGVIGQSALGRELYYVRVGDTRSHRAIVTAGIHAREHLSSYVVAEQVYYTLAHAAELDGGILYLPMLNPDGVELCLHGLRSVKSTSAAAYLRRINGSTDFALWKANAHAVDLNCNFPALWGSGKAQFFAPRSGGYVGPFAASEPEVQALLAFTHRVRPDYTVSYHTKGREIYWEFGQTGARRDRDRAFAEVCADVTGFALVDGTLSSAGGYKDYCITALGIPALTVELVDDAEEHPVPVAAAREEIHRTKTLGVALNARIRELCTKNVL